MAPITAADGPVAVTGASGFIGAHVTKNLVARELPRRPNPRLNEAVLRLSPAFHTPPPLCSCVVHRRLHGPGVRARREQPHTYRTPAGHEQQGCGPGRAGRGRPARRRCLRRDLQGMQRGLPRRGQLRNVIRSLSLFFASFPHENRCVLEDFDGKMM